MTRRTWAAKRAGAPLSNRVALFAGRRLCLFFLRMFYRLRLEGAEHVPERGPLIVVSNHQSYLDPIAIGLLAWKRPFRPIAQAGLLRFKPVGWLVSLYGGIYVDKRGGDLGAIRLAIDEINGGQAVIIFPEGGRSRDGRVKPFQRGFELILRRTGAPVLPVTIEGSFDVWPAHRPFPRLSGRIVVRACPIIPHDQFFAAGADAIEGLRRTIESRRLVLRDDLRRTSRGRFPAETQGDRPYWECDSEHGADHRESPV